MDRKWQICSVLTVLLLLFQGCPFNVDKEEIKPFPYVIFDSDAGVLPQPNDLSVQSLVAGLTAAPTNAFEELIANYLSLYLKCNYESCNGQPQTGGWDPNAKITIPVQGKVNESTVAPNTIRVLDVTALLGEIAKARASGTEAGKVTITASNLLTRLDKYTATVTHDTTTDRSTIAIVPPNDPAKVYDGWTMGHRYLVLVTKEVKGTNDLSVIGGQAFNFMKSPTPLFINGVQQVSSLVDEKTAMTLEAARSGFVDMLNYLATDAAGNEKIARSDYGAFFFFTVRSQGIARNDLATQDIPTPNNAVINPTTGKVAFPVCGKSCESGQVCQFQAGVPTCVATNTSCDPACSKQGYACVGGSCVKRTDTDDYVFSYLNTFDGFSATSALTVHFDVEIDLATLEGNFKVVDVTDPNAPVEVPGWITAWDQAFLALNVVPPSRLTPGHSYFIYFTNGVKDKSGNPLLPSSSTGILRLSRSLVAEKDGKTVSTVPLVPDKTDADKANLLLVESLRKMYDGYFSAVEKASILDDRNKTVSFWAFSIGKYFEAQFNPAVPSPSLNPFPSVLFLDQAPCKDPLKSAAECDKAEDKNAHFGKVNLPLIGDAVTKQLIAGLNTLDGFSPLLPIVMPVSQDVDQSSLTTWDGNPANLSVPNAIAVNIGSVFPDPGQSPKKLEKTTLAVTYRKTSAAILFQPPLTDPMEPKSYYIMGLQEGVMSDETTPQKLNASPIFHMARGTGTLVDDDPLTPDTDETVWKTPLWDPQTNTSLVRAVENPTSARSLELLRQQYTRMLNLIRVLDNRLDPTKVVLISVHKVMSIAEELQGLRAYIFGTLTTVTATGTVGTDYTSLSAYTTADLGGVILDGTFKALVLTGAPDPLTGAAAFEVGTDGLPAQKTATDLKYVASLPSGTGPFPVVIYQHDYQRNKMDLFTVANDLAKRGYAAIAIDLPYHGDRKSGGNDGDLWLGLNPFGMRDSIRQAALDHGQLLRALTAINTQTGSKLDVGKVFLLGVGYGSVVGTLSCGLEPSIRACGLNTVGGFLSQIFLNAPNPIYQAEIFASLSLVGIQPGTAAFEQLVVLFQTALDRGDPLNWARYLEREPLTDSLTLQKNPEKPTVFQTAKGDDLIPAAFGSAMMGAASKGQNSNIKLTEYNTCHAFLVDPSKCTTDADAATDRDNALGEILDLFDANK